MPCARRSSSGRRRSGPRRRRTRCYASWISRSSPNSRGRRTPRPSSTTRRRPPRSSARSSFGATACLYSLTKGTSGHADLLLGAVTSRDEALVGQLRAWRSNGGGIPGPFEAYLAHRGVLTLPLRAARQSETALALARHLDDHPRVTRVYYPALEPTTLDVARRQMPLGFGPLLSFEIEGDADAAFRVVEAARLIRASTSFGGVDSSWERRARWASETVASPTLIRLSAGLEAVDDLIADIDAALDA